MNNLREIGRGFFESSAPLKVVPLDECHGGVKLVIDPDGRIATVARSGGRAVALVELEVARAHTTNGTNAGAVGLMAEELAGLRERVRVLEDAARAAAPAPAAPAAPAPAAPAAPTTGKG